MGVGAALLSAFARARNVPRRGWKVLSTKEYKRVYKGKGAMQAGRLTPFGNFRADPLMAPRYEVPPGLESFALRPYVAHYPGQRGVRSAKGLRARILEGSPRAFRFNADGDDRVPASAVGGGSSSSSSTQASSSKANQKAD